MRKILLNKCLYIAQYEKMSQYKYKKITGLMKVNFLTMEILLKKNKPNQ